jgi:hypothetical protein
LKKSGISKNWIEREVRKVEKIGLVPEEIAEILHIGAKQVREYAENDPTFPVFAVGSKKISTYRALEEWATNRAKLRVGMKAHSSRVADIVMKKRRMA